MKSRLAALSVLVPGLLAQAPPTAAPNPKPGDWKGLGAFAASEAKQDRFSGVLLVARHGTILLQEVEGSAHRGDGIPNTLDTRFNLASMGKLFTAVAIGQLVEQGKVGLDDPILKYLPEYKDQPGWDKVKIKHLLSHTAGFGNYWGPAFDAKRADIRAVKDYFPLFTGKPLAFEPGTRWSYSNVGFIILGAIIERASGEDYFGYIQKHIFDPAGMKDSGYFELDRDTPRLAEGYFHPRDGDGKLLSQDWLNDRLQVVAKGGPAGGGYATAPDLVRFAEAVMSGKLVKAETLQTLTTAHATFPKPPGAEFEISYGYGFDLEQRGSQLILGHNGGAPGIATDLLMEPATGTVVVMLSNLDPADLGRVPDRIREVWPR
ncbi:MAG TPA: serine hydrolase domain-containing protein [Holophagaceae bacterium]|jgi:CubicO group peptidase (beta-lactamase class C family)|nr:serine hydrolase domain-containing protein [Holophagaceae bacterium]